MFRLISASALILACGLGAGCADDDPIAAPIETPVAVDETFTGTVNVNGASSHIFSTERPGQAIVRLESLAPDPAAIVSLIFGSWNGSYCSVVFVKDDATTGSTMIGNASPGAFCVRLSDIGHLTEATSYSVKVTHF
jgi:hypothetical protein